ncbi:hypothetical protein ACFL6G_09930 [candidate division KSB1 bacterium]
MQPSGWSHSAQNNAGLGQNNIQPGGLTNNRIQQTEQRENNNSNNPVVLENRNNAAANQDVGGAAGRREELAGVNDPLIGNENPAPRVEVNTERNSPDALQRAEQNALLENSGINPGQAEATRENPEARGIQRTESNQIQNIEGNNARVANQTPAKIAAGPGINEGNQLGSRVDVLA